MQFPRTQEKLYEMAASQPLMAGVHQSDMPTTGRYGLVMGEAVYDPLVDTPSNIKIDSVKARITGAPHTRVIIPRENMNANLVVDTESGNGDYWHIAKHKQKLAIDIANSIWEASPSSTDWFNVYYLGDNASRELTHIADPIEVKEVAGVCVSGITMVMSDFQRLRFDQKLTNSIGIKVNHPAELELPANVGIIPVGAGIEVDTDKPRKLNRANEQLLARRQEILGLMAASGLKAVEVVFNPKFSNGFDSVKTDMDLAQAINASAKR